MLTGRRCIVTGAAQGMGREIALEVARQDAAAVTVLDVLDEKGEETAALVRDLGARATYTHCDLRSGAAIKQAVEAAVAEYGGLDVLINNAGVIERSFTDDVDFDVVPEHLWDLVMDVNVKAAWLLSRYSAPHLRVSRLSPAIVNAASIAGRVAYSHALYGVSKAALIQLTRTMAVTLAPDVRVNCYCPGTIETEMSSTARSAAGADPRVTQITEANLLPRLGTSNEVAKLACFLASEDAGFSTGAVYDIDGGALAWRGHR